MGIVTAARRVAVTILPLFDIFSDCPYSSIVSVNNPVKDRQCPVM